MKTRYCPLWLVFLVGASGCAALAPLSQSLDDGQPVPAGKVLVIGKFTFDPPMRQGPMAVVSVKGEEKGVIKLWMAQKADSPVTASSALFGASLNEAMDARLHETSFIPLAPGLRYIRTGYVTVHATGRYAMTSRGVSPAGVNAARIELIKDIKVDVPKNAKAVYIGTIVYKHDGAKATAVQVRDEYRRAMRELASRKIPGISPGDVVKRLAVAVKGR